MKFCGSWKREPLLVGIKERIIRYARERERERERER